MTAWRPWCLHAGNGALLLALERPTLRDEDMLVSAIIDVDLPVPGPEGGERNTHMDLVAIVRDDPHVSDQALRPGMWTFRMRGALLQSLNPLLPHERVVGDDMRCGIRSRGRIRTGD